MNPHPQPLSPPEGRGETPLFTARAEPSSVRAWFYLVRLSIQRQARAHLMVWIALGLLAFSLFIVALNAQAGLFSMRHWRYPRRVGPPFQEYLVSIEEIAGGLPWAPGEGQMLQAATGTFRAVLDHSSGFFVFSNWIVFSLFTTFLLPLWSLSFATEALGRERESRSLLWLLTRPLSRPAIYLAKYVSILPWCLLLNLGGFGLLCWAGGTPGRLAFSVYWPAVFWATLAFCSLFHLLAVCVRRPAMIALLYSFFLETVMGNLTGYSKRLSISFYTRCLMFDRAHEFGIRPERPAVYLPVSGTTAWLVLAGVTGLCLLAGMMVFSWREYLDSAT